MPTMSGLRHAAEASHHHSYPRGHRGRKSDPFGEGLLETGQPVPRDWNRNNAPSRERAVSWAKAHGVWLASAPACLLTLATGRVCDVSEHGYGHHSPCQVPGRDHDELWMSTLHHEPVAIQSQPYWLYEEHLMRLVDICRVYNLGLRINTCMDAWWYPEGCPSVLIYRKKQWKELEDAWEARTERLRQAAKEEGV